MARLFGDWEKFRRWKNKIKFGAFRIMYQKDLDDLGIAIENRVKQHIARQDLNWTPLAKSTIEKKGHGKVYIETTEYMNSIRVQVKTTGRFSLDLVVEPQGFHSGAKMPMGELAKIHEYGTTHIPSRPIWRPTFEEMQNMPEFAKLIDLGVKFGFDI